MDRRRIAILRRHVWCLVPAFCILLSGTTGAQQQQQQQQQQQRRLQAADTSSPRGTLHSFMEACNETYQVILSDKYLDARRPDHAHVAQRIVDCVSTSEIPAYARQHRATEIAICIKEILDREELPDWDEIPDEQAIEAAGGPDKLSVWTVPGTRITIARIDEGPQKHEYLFSSGTAARAVTYFEQVRPEPYRTSGPAVSRGFYDWYVSVPGDRHVAAIVQTLPDFLKRDRTFGVANWKWIGIAFITLFGGALMLLAYRLQWSLSDWTRDKGVFTHCSTVIFPLLAMLVPLIAQHLIENVLTIRGDLLYVLSFLANVMTILAGIVLIFAIANRIAALIIASPRINPLGLDAQLIRITAKLASLVATIALIICGGQFLGIPIGTLLASAGIVGAALALAAQDTLKNLFGTLVLFGDKPFRVGDRIKLVGFDGFVEDIGLRSTRIRLLNKHLVTLPNSQLAGSDIENVSCRSHIRQDGAFQIPLDTPCDKIKQAVAIVRDKLADHEGMDPENPPRVFFQEIDSIAFQIGFVYWYSPPDYWKFRDFGDWLNFAILEEFEEHGIQFSLPLRHTFWKFDDRQGPLDVNLISGDPSIARDPSGG